MDQNPTATELPQTDAMRPDGPLCARVMQRV